MTDRFNDIAVAVNNNPWIAAISFDVIRANIDQVLSYSGADAGSQLIMAGINGV